MVRLHQDKLYVTMYCGYVGHMYGNDEIIKHRSLSRLFNI